MLGVRHHPGPLSARSPPGTKGPPLRSWPGWGLPLGPARKRPPLPRPFTQGGISDSLSHPTFRGQRGGTAVTVVASTGLFPNGFLSVEGQPELVPQ